MHGYCTNNNPQVQKSRVKSWKYLAHCLNLGTLRHKLHNRCLNLGRAYFCAPFRLSLSMHGCLNLGRCCKGLAQNEDLINNGCLNLGILVF